MSTSRALRLLSPVLAFLLSLALGGAPPAAARRSGPSVTPVQTPEGVLENQALLAAQQGGYELRGCEQFASRAGAPGQVVLQLRMVGGQLQVSAAQNRGGARFTGCLEQTMANVVLRTAHPLAQHRELRLDHGDFA